MRIDLHTHSRASDGTETPGELVRAAAAAGLDVVAITDHDTATGWDEAAAVAAEVDIELVRGMEISTKHQGVGVHLLAYLPDPTHPGLAAAHDKVLDGRTSRVPAMLDKLRDHGIDIDIADVRRVAAGTAATGRPHVADALVELGAVADRGEAFRTLLNPGRPAYVDRYAASLVDIIGAVTAAGGVSVIAHPWGRHGSGEPGEETLADLVEVGLAGIEVDHQDHDADDRARLRDIGANLGLGKVDHDLGCNTTAPEQYARLLDLAAATAARSGRPTPEVLRP